MNETTSPRQPGLLRATALMAALAGAAGSAAFLLRAGQQTSRLLLLIMMLWVLSPFMAVVSAAAVSKRWPALPRAVLYIAMLLHATGSLAIYAYNSWRPPKTQAGFFFVMVPLVSWVLISIVVPTAALLSGRLSRRTVRSRLSRLT